MYERDTFLTKDEFRNFSFRGLDATDRDNITRPVVYIIWLGDVCVYVGESIKGIKRPRGTQHHVTSETDYDMVELRWQPDADKPALRAMQLKLIKELKPVSNYQLNLESATLRPRRKNVGSGYGVPSVSYDEKTNEFLLILKNPERVQRYKDWNTRQTALIDELERIKKARL
jgi:hypothetical protein